MLVPRPMAAKADTIRNLLAVFIMPETVAGIQPMLLMMASAKNPQMNHGMTLTMLTYFPSGVAACSSFCFIRVPTKAKTRTVGMMAMVRVSFTIVAKSPAISEKAYPEATTLAVSLTDVPAQMP